MASPRRDSTRKRSSSRSKKSTAQSPVRAHSPARAPSQRSRNYSRRGTSPVKSPKRGSSPSRATRARRRSSGSSSRPLTTTLGGTMTFQGTSRMTTTRTLNDNTSSGDTVSFCRKVKHTFRNKPHIYQQFVKILSEVREEDSDKVDIIKRVILLFDGHPQLVMEFNQFLPIDYKIEMQGDAVLVKVYDEPDEDNVGLVETGRLGMLSTRGTMTYGPGMTTSKSGQFTTTRSFDNTMMGTSNTMGETQFGTKSFDESMMYTSNNTMGETQFGTATLGPNKDATVEYIRKVKKAYSGKPRIYQRFMDALRAYHKDEADVLDTIKKVVALFQNHTDLVLGFNEFLPRSYKIRMFDKNGYLVEHPSSEDEDKLDSFQIMLDHTFA